MAYAAIADLKARTGRLALTWSASTHPKDPDDLQRFLDDAAARIDGVLSGWSVTVPLVDAAVVSALRPLNAKMAALDALVGSFPGGQAPSTASDLIGELRSELYGANGDGGEWGTLMSGKHPAIVIIVQGGGVPEASSFWTDEPGYGIGLTYADRQGMNPYLAPGFEVGMKL